MKPRIIRKAAVLAAVSIALLAAPVDRAAAQGVPVYDASSVAQLIEQVANQLEQLATMKAQLESLTGARGLGAFMNSPEDIAARAAAENLSGLVDGAITGSPILGNTARLAATIERLKGNYQLDLLGPYASSELAQNRALATLGGSSLAAMATGEDSYLRANEAMMRVNRLVPQIDGPDRADAGDERAAAGALGPGQRHRRAGAVHDARADGFAGILEIQR